MSNKIQASESTANLLMASGKGHWVAPRIDVVNAKGKGVLRTFWLEPTSSKASSSLSLVTDDLTSTSKERDDLARHDRRIDWVVELFKEYIKPILAKQKAQVRRSRRFLDTKSSSDLNTPMETPLAEVKDAIDLPAFDPKLMAQQEEMAKTAELDDALTQQLRDYIASVASQYRSNPFHNFEHAW